MEQTNKKRELSAYTGQPLPGLVIIVQRSARLDTGAGACSSEESSGTDMSFCSSSTGWYKSATSGGKLKVRRCQGRT